MSTLNTVISSIKSVVKGEAKAISLLPNTLLLCVSLQRPGISAMDIAAAYIQYNASIGIPTGANTDGSPNLINASAYGLIKSWVDNYKMNGVVSFALPPGAISVTAIGANAGGEVVCKGTNDGYITGQGIPG